MTNDSAKPILRVLDGESCWPPPLWIMRQAGRYLPEYRALRATAPSFLDFCYTPDLAAEATLQPIRRFGLDAAIIFSDILVIPHVLGLDVTFVENEGPKLGTIDSAESLDRLAPTLPMDRVEPVYEALRRVKAALPPTTALIGFCGAPWTVASYMIAGKSTPDQAPARLLAYRDPDLMAALIDRLVEASVDYLIGQVDAGAEVLQIFESFGGAVPPALLDRLSLDPIRRIVAGVRTARPGTRIIVFVRGIGPQLPRLAQAGLEAGLALDWTFDLGQAVGMLPPDTPSQGNLDPLAVCAGGSALDRGIDALLAAARGRPHIVNLGHGILPQTPIPHVEHLVKRVRAA